MKDTKVYIMFQELVLLLFNGIILTQNLKAWGGMIWKIRKDFDKSYTSATRSGSNPRAIATSKRQCKKPQETMPVFKVCGWRKNIAVSGTRNQIHPEWN